MNTKNTNFYDVAVIGCGSIGLATAYYLARNHGVSRIALIDCGQPMAFTSAQSGENYRNWWPHASMVAFTNRSIDLLEEFALGTDNRINMNRRGYALATRQTNIDELVQQLHDGFGEDADMLVRYHENSVAPSYQPPDRPDWKGVQNGVDILRNRDLIQATFPSFANDIQTIVHIRRGGNISGQQLGMVMLEYLKQSGAKHVSGSVENIRSAEHFTVVVHGREGVAHITARKIVNAAGPFANVIAGMLGSSLPIYNTLQQKIAFEDREHAILREMPFAIDLDAQKIDWLDDERELLLEDANFRWLAEEMPGAIHCRPDGGDNSTWVKLGWAFNKRRAHALWDPPLDDNFPDVVLRGAARLNPALRTYYGKLPRSLHHYAGWYTMTEENWPLIGPMEIKGAYVNCAMSGFGTMAACAGGELCAAWVAGAKLPHYAREFSLQRYNDDALMQLLQSCNKGIL